MNAEPDRLAEAEQSLRRALHLMTYPNNYQPEEWSLLASLIAEAGLIVSDERRRDPSFQSFLLDQAVEELRDMTRGFTDPGFLKATRAARRRNPGLFTGRG